MLGGRVPFCPVFRLLSEFMLSLFYFGVSFFVVVGGPVGINPGFVALLAFRGAVLRLQVFRVVYLGVCGTLCSLWVLVGDHDVFVARFLQLRLVLFAACFFGVFVRAVHLYFLGRFFIEVSFAVVPNLVLTSLICSVGGVSITGLVFSCFVSFIVGQLLKECFFFFSRLLMP
ncbi:hypothetical protein [Escherichia coli]|uniref:hypothetical protein n=1 Tax=Escherichia coli TaxID=562 RepID=UPI0011E8EE99|nr:hypothetical protein [Escherichia coli]